MALTRVNSNVRVKEQNSKFVGTLLPRAVSPSFAMAFREH
jgi:hypothetical protein